MAKIIIIRGNSASGKTSLAKAVQSQFPEKCIILSQDIIRRDLLGAHDGFDTPTITLLIHLIDFSYPKLTLLSLKEFLEKTGINPSGIIFLTTIKMTAKLITMIYPLKKPSNVMQVDQSPMILVKMP